MRPSIGRSATRSGPARIGRPRGISARRHRRSLLLLASVALSVAACGGGSAATSGVSASSTPTGTAASSVTPTPAFATPAPPTTAPTPPVARISLPLVAPEAPLKLVWAKAGPTPKAGATSALAAAPDGRVLAVSANDDVIWEFKPDGTYLGAIGGPGKADGQFDFTDGRGNAFGFIAFEPDGAFFVSDTGHHRIQAFGKDGAFVKVIGSFGTGDGQFASPVGVAIGPQGDIYVADASNSIQELTRGGAFVRRFSQGIDYTNSQAPMLAVDPSGNVWTTVAKTLVELAPDGTEIAELDFSAYGYPDGLVADARGNLWVPTDTTANSGAATGPLVEIDGHGGVIHVWPSTGDQASLDPSGSAIYLSFFQQADVQKYALPKP